ncbi:hypothetical protein I8H83_03730 [Candidatus Saccharibacteria bacterium]|nr:hypothetical protein [Candidatus Saccharibacteria bacterium]
MSELSSEKHKDESRQLDDHELELSHETSAMLNKAIDQFLDALPSEKVEIDPEDEEWSSRDYNITLSDGDLSVRVRGVGLFREGFGVALRPFLTIERGTDESSDSDFSFVIEDGVGTFEYDEEEGAIVDRPGERVYFKDTLELDAREQVLLDDVTFDGAGDPDSIVMPNFETTPTGEIFENGVEETTQKQMLGGVLNMGYTARYANDDERRLSERRMAAWRHTDDGCTCTSSYRYFDAS